MNPSEETELDCILIGANYMECDEATEQPRSTPELLGAVRTSTNDAEGTEGIAPHEESGGELWLGGGSCQGPSLSLMAQLLCIHNNSYTIISFGNFTHSPKTKINKDWSRISASPI